ncbi:MAG: hypothetical protein JWQ97_4161 [Phenylobacterium sp.]|nr:hypothetical protein [Phenylobacterium sp.]
MPVEGSAIQDPAPRGGAAAPPHGAAGFASRSAMFAAWGVVAGFLFFFVISYIDRTIITMMVAPLERDLGISDFQMSLLLGPAFGIFYGLCGVPVGWFVDRFPRKLVAAIGIALWGLATTVCGLAAGFGHLLIGRIGVGVGESALTPAAHATIAERFPKSQLATALSIYTLGVSIGTGLSILVGGAVVEWLAKAERLELPLIGVVHGWQLVFLTIGLITLAISPFALLLGGKTVGPAPLVRARASGRPPLSFMKLIAAEPMLFLALPIGFGFTAAVSVGMSAWIPTFFLREYGWSMAKVGGYWGLINIIAGAGGQVVGALIVDRLYARGVTDAHARYHVLGLFISTPCAAAAFLAHDPALTLVLLTVYFFVTFPCFGYAAAALQLFAPDHLRARISALNLALVAVIGSLLGPPFVGLLVDHVFHDKAKLGVALATLAAVGGPIVGITLAFVARRMRQAHRPGVLRFERFAPAEIA